MNTVEEIEQAIEQLPSHDLVRLKAWISQRDNDEWDRQMDDDATNGRLEVLFDEAREERREGMLREWPPQ